MTRHRTSGAQRGSATVETVLLVPMLVISVLFVVNAGRVAGMRHKVDHAAGVAARAASLVSADRQWRAAEDAARLDLDESNMKCRDLAVRLERRRVAGRDAIRARVSCTSDVAGLAVLRSAGTRLTGESTEVIDVFTHRY